MGGLLVKVNLEEINAELDLRYATANNICGRPLYRKDTGLWLHAETAERLKLAGRSARTKGYVLLIFDGYRPRRVQEVLWEKCPDEHYVANPDNGGSMHTRGIAVDLTLAKWEITRMEPVIRETPPGVVTDVVEGGKADLALFPLDMGTGFDDMSEAAHWDASEKGLITQAQHGHRMELRRIMEAAGFNPMPTEWWHYQMLPPNLGPGKFAYYSLEEENRFCPMTHPDLS